jgi:hypothetical protein
MSDVGAQAAQLLARATSSSWQRNAPCADLRPLRRQFDKGAPAFDAALKE